MRKALWNNRILVINILLLASIKLSLAYPASGLIGVISNSQVFSRDEIVKETNNFRIQIGQPALKTNPSLQAAADDKLADMIVKQYFAHMSPQGADPWHWLTINNYKYTYAGENLAIGFFDAADTVEAWANSPSHRKNMASPNFSEVGVAVRSAKIGDLEGIVVVQFFGKPLVPKVAPTPLAISVIQTPTPSTTPTKTATVTPEKSVVRTPAPSRTSELFLQETQNNSGIVVTHPRGHDLATYLDRTFLVYAGIVAIFSVILIVASASRQLYWPFAVLHVIIFLSALLVEPISITRIGLIL